MPYDRDELLGRVGHDLRNPISVMVLAASVLQRRPDLPPDAQRLVERIVANGERATRLLDDVVELMAIRQGVRLDREPLDLREVAAAEGVRVTGAGDGRGRWDRARVGRMLAHLATAPGASDLDVSSAGEAVRVGVVATSPATGLWLDLVRAIAEAHGGRLDVTSEPGGARLTVTLPRA